MPELNYKLATGINQDTLFNVKLDTQERMRDLYEGFNPMTFDEAVDREIEIGIDLRGAGFGVWQA